MKLNLAKWVVCFAAGVMAVGGAAVTGYGAPANLYWDANGDTAGTGGTGTWNLADSTWRLGSATGTPQAWNNDVNGNSAYLAGTVGTLTLGDNITVALLSSSSGYVINGDGGGLYKLTLDSTSKVGGDGGSYAVMMANGTGPLTVNAPVVLAGPVCHQYRGTITFNGVVSGSAGVGTLAGNTLTLTNANTFTGGYGTVNGGTLVIGHDQAMGTGPILTTGVTLQPGKGNRTISNPITPTGGGVFYMATDGTNNLTLAGGAGTGTVGGKDPTFTVNNPVLTINRPLWSYADGNYGRYFDFVNKNGTGTLVLAQASSPVHGYSSGVNVNAGTLIVNGQAYAATSVSASVSSNSAQWTLTSGTTANLHVGQAVQPVSGYTDNNLVILSIDDATHFTVSAPWNANYTGSPSVCDAAGLGSASYNVTVSNAATLGGSGTIVLATGKTNTILAGGTIAPGSITAGTEVGTLTVTNGTFDFQQNAIYAWQYKDGAGDKVRVYGTLILPSVATVSVSQVSGSMPADPPIFTATTLAGATSLTNWVVTGVQNYTVQISGTTNVILKAPPMGTIIMFK
jgi:fibronectin-binding autotransporter adhesin